MDQMAARVLLLLFLEQLPHTLVAEAEAVARLVALIHLVALEALEVEAQAHRVMELRQLLELLILEAVEAVAQMVMLPVQQVALALSSFHTQTLMRRQQPQQVHQL